MTDPEHNNTPGFTRRIAIAIELDQCVPWHQDCCEGILRYGQSQGWDCVIDPFLLGPGGQKSAKGYDGVVGRIESEVAEAALADGVPVVNHWNNSPARDLPSVLTDLRADGQLAGEHLLNCGYKQLAYLNVHGDETTLQRVDGLGLVAMNAGLAPPAVRLLETEMLWSDPRQWHVDFLKEAADWLTGLQPPVGLLVGDSTLARYLAQFAPQWGLSVPGDLGIVVWNDDMSTHAISPTLSVIDHDWYEIGYQSAALLDELMMGKAAHPLHRLAPAMRLIPRDSTDVFLCEDELVRAAMRYIAEHCREEVYVDDIAEALGTSRRTLYRKFDEVLGRSIKDEIRRLRTDRIKTTIEETSLSFSRIADMFGFSTAGQFSRYFKSTAGVSPSLYRKKHSVRVEP